MRELLSNWNEFINWVVENIPNYTDNDISFTNFMDWYENYNQKEDPHDY